MDFPFADPNYTRFALVVGISTVNYGNIELTSISSKYKEK